MTSFPRKRESILPFGNETAGRADERQAAGSLHFGECSARHSLYRSNRWLRHRVWEHRERLIDGFTKTHGVKHLVWFELFANFADAIKRETQMKRWNRAWKLQLIEDTNPGWHDLWFDLND
jgi:putative endonuclease